KGDFRVYSAKALPDRQNPWEASFLVNTLNNGVLLLDSNACPLKRIDQENGMPAHFVWNSAEGPQGSGILWSGTNKGLARWHLGDPRTFAWEGKAFSGGVEKVLQHKGDLYVATYQGVYRRKSVPASMFSEHGRWERYGKFKFSSYDMEKAPAPGNNAILVAAGNEGIFVLPTGKEKEERMPLQKKHSYSIEPLSIKDTHLIVTAGREGMSLLETVGDRRKLRMAIREIPKEIKLLERIEKGDPLHREGYLSFFLVFGSDRLELLDVELGRLWDRSFPDTLSWKNAPKHLSGIELRELQVDSLPGKELRPIRLHERIFIGTQNGLFEPVPKEDKVRFRPTERKGAFLKGVPPGKSGNAPFVHVLEERKNGTLWLSNGNKTYRILPRKDGKGYRVDSLSLRGKGNKGSQDFCFEEGGVTWIGSTSGVLHFDRTVERRTHRDFACRIREVSVLLPQKNASKEAKKASAETSRDSTLFAGFYRKPAPADSLLPWQPSQEQPEAYVPLLPYQKNGLHFLFAAPFFEGQEEMLYSYKLQGYDKRWSPWKRKASKTYTNLPEGRYRFKVRAKNLFGRTSKVAEYRFRILPPWYRTYTAYVGYGVLAVLFVWLIAWMNAKRLAAQKRRLEEIVDQRTQEIRAQKEKTEEQKEKVEEAHAQITQSIDYAQKIQYALLQTEEQISSQALRHFILFKPQSQVSGDFYWMKEQKGYCYIAAVDCTGHGVPGAFMSMLGISQLNEIMNTDEELTPGYILTELRDRVVRELSGSDPESAAKDGMDAALVKVPIANSNSDSKGQDPGGHSVGRGFNPGREEDEIQIEFAGAQNPLYVIRKGIGEEPAGDLTGPEDLSVRFRPFKKTSNGIEIKGDGQPVGYDEYAKEA
ncbi:MAG: triple tyrosine motif-containing protein, partial [Flavobacteriales bacterium]